jgi:hypothetical protein
MTISQAQRKKGVGAEAPTRKSMKMIKSSDAQWRHRFMDADYAAWKGML